MSSITVLLVLLVTVTALALLPTTDSFPVHRQQQQQGKPLRFHHQQHHQHHQQHHHRDGIATSRTIATSSTRCYNFLKDAFENAFSNDRTLSTDKRKGQYDDIYTGEEYVNNDDEGNSNSNSNSEDDGLTEVQRKWRQVQQLQSGSIGSGSGNSNGGVINDDGSFVVGQSLLLDLYLSGVPEKDPSNDLYGSRVNISSRDRGTGLLSLPPEASVKNLRLDLLPGGVCGVSGSGFTASSDTDGGAWRLSDDGTTLRFAINALGYTRTVRTRGTIQKVYWTDEEEKTSATSTTYSIPPGMVYGDLALSQQRRHKNTVFALDPNNREGALRVEKSTGLFGISSQMVACGKFVAAVYRRED